MLLETVRENFSEYGREFGTLLATSRRERGLTQEALAEATALSVRAIREMERGRVQAPQRRTVTILADALGWSEADRARFIAAGQADRLRRTLAMTGSGTAAPAGGAPAELPPLAPAELPAAVADLVGRDAELAALRGLSARAGAGQCGGPTLVSLHGPPGIGKTSLAVYAGHLLSGYFQDGQLFVDLRGTARDCRDPEDVLAGFLRSLGADGGSFGERAGRYRTVTRRRRLLVVLDNAADEAQVRPLLPAGYHCLVLVTSRRPLSGLEAVHRIGLDVLPAEEARRMLHTIVGPARAAREVEPVDRLVSLCGRLPLALRIAGNRLASRPAWRVTHLVDQLDDQRHRLAVLTAGDLDVRAAFEVSYQQLSPAARRMFRQASLVPGETFGVELIAAATGAAVPEARRTVEEIVDVGLLLSSGDRYRFHDLIGLYARECLTADESPEYTAEIRERMVDWLLRRTTEAGSVFLPGHCEPGDDAHVEAQVWLTAEAPNWLAALRDAAARGRHGDVVRTVTALHWYSDVAHRHPWETVFRIGVEAARAGGLVAEEAVLLNFLGWAQGFCTQRYEDALVSHGRALRLARRGGDAGEQAWARAYSAGWHTLLGHPRRAVPLARRALAQFREIGHGLGEHYALGKLGNALGALGDHAGALEAHRAVLDYYRRGSGLTTAGISVASAGALRCIAQDLAGLGRWRPAADTYLQAARLFAGFGAVLGEANAAYGEGLALRELGEPAAARTRLHRALTLYAHLTNPWGEAQAAYALSRLAVEQAGDQAEAGTLLRRALDRCAEVDGDQARRLGAEIRDLLGQLGHAEQSPPNATHAVG